MQKKSQTQNRKGSMRYKQIRTAQNQIQNQTFKIKRIRFASELDLPEGTGFLYRMLATSFYLHTVYSRHAK